MKLRLRAAAAALALFVGGAVHAGPYILAGTDADDHGSSNGTTNFDGWLFMQKALENIAASSSLTNPNHVVYSLGSDTGSQAGNAAASAFNLSSLAGAGWTFVSVPVLTDAAMTAALAAGGIIMLDSSFNVGGGLDSSELAVLTARAADLNTFVGNGGGLFSQANEYGWLSALVPSLGVVDYSDQGLTLTADGSAAFPGLTNGDLSAGPWHEYFTNTGAIPVLATGLGPNGLQVPVIIGASGGSITNPNNPVPEPETYALMIAGLAALGVVSRRRKQRA